MLKPARAKSCTVASCSEPFGIPSLSFISGLAFRELVRTPEKARPLDGVTDVAAAKALHAHEHGVLVAVDQQVADREPVAGRLTLRPQLVARAAEERHVAGFARDVPGLLVHEPDHQHVAGPLVLHDCRYEPVKFREVHTCLAHPSGPRQADRKTSAGRSRSHATAT